MKIIMEQYARGFIAMLIALAVIQIWKDGTFLEKIGKQYSLTEGNVHMGSAFQNWKQKEYPKFAVVGEYELKVGQWTPFERIFSCTTKEGAFCNNQVLQVFSEDFIQREFQLSTEGDSICIANAGIYWILLEGGQEENNTSLVMVKLFVNER